MPQSEAETRKQIIDKSLAKALLNIKDPTLVSEEIDKLRICGVAIKSSTKSGVRELPILSPPVSLISDFENYIKKLKNRKSLLKKASKKAKRYFRV